MNSLTVKLCCLAIGAAFIALECASRRFKSQIKYLRCHKKRGEEEKHKLLNVVCDLVEKPFRTIAICLQVVLIILLIFVFSNVK
jgi:hypothetical protein